MEEESELKIREMRKQAALDEIKEAKEKKGKDWTWLLNNFHLYLPNEKSGKGYYEQSSADLDWLDKKPSEYDAEAQDDYSAIRYDQTDRDFFKTIDEVIDRLQIDRRKLQSLMDLLSEPYNDNPDRWGQAFDELIELYIPVYAELRSMGYDNRDLTK
jgi:hypothetical protein